MDNLAVFTFGYGCGLLMMGLMWCAFNLTKGDKDDDIALGDGCYLCDRVHVPCMAQS
jgi:hypothetical protein